MKKRTHFTQLAVLLAAIFIVLSGCDPVTTLGEGTLSIALGSSRSLMLLPEIDMEIATYTISGSGPNGGSFEEEGFGGFVFERSGLAAGDWEITVDGYNAGGTRIGTAVVELTIRKNQTTSATATLRPLEGTGTFSGTVSWTDSQGVLGDPQVWVTVRDEDGDDIPDISIPTQLTVSGQTASGSTELPAGWYEVTVGLYEGVPGGDALVVWQGVLALRIVADQTTSGTLEIPEEQIRFGTGWVSIVIEEDMDDPFDVFFTVSPEVVVTGEATTFTSTGSHSGSAQYRWYVDGERQDESSTVFGHTFSEAGEHTVSLLVLDGGVLCGYGQSVAVTEAVLQPDYSIPLTYVEGGTFQMGSNDYSWEQPIHPVTLDSFYMGTYEITQEIYEQVMGSNPSYFTKELLPVEQVSWYEAVAFANALSRRDGLEEVYTIDGTTVGVDWSKVGYRLPTEAEWEYAARGGNLSQGYTYSGSNTVDDVAWYDGNSGGATHDVGGKAANELGLYDMSGNVWEWVWDWYENCYSATVQTNPTGPSTGSYRVTRGGSWNGDAMYGLSAFRSSSTPSNQSIIVGFRLILPAD